MIGPRAHEFSPGVDIIVEPLRQRYALAPDVPPPPGMTREEFGAWSRRVCGFMAPLIPDNQTIVMGGKVYMNRSTFNRLMDKT